MADEPLPQPDESAPVDPFEAELVAYLDGELDEPAARRIEARLASDPAARARAAELKKTYDLLDYLPRPEPSSTFTTRTLDKLPALKSGSLPVPIPTGSMPASSASGSSSVAAPASPGGLSGPLAPRRSWIVAASIVFAMVGLGAAGYFTAAILRPHLFPSREAGPEELPLSDHRLIENLPLYAAVDDFEFAQRLAEPEYFGDDLAIGLDPQPDGVASEPGKISRPEFDALAREFKALPPLRQQAIRDLDRHLQAAEPATRERLVRVLEAYAVWLSRLPETERKGVLAAATPGLRLAVIHDIRERQWLDALPASQRAQLAGMSDVKKAEKIQQWREEEAKQRSLWMFVRRNPEAILGVKPPWPFETEAGRKEVIEFIRSAFKPDDPKRTRLTPTDLAAYREALAGAETNGQWVWYGKAVYDLVRKYEMLPEPADSSQMYLDFADLPPPFNKLAERPKAKKGQAIRVGKWPEFPLDVHQELGRGTKLGPLPPLGPARVSDFKEPVLRFFEKELALQLSPQERAGLQRLENRWPEYPREFVRLARVHDLSIPGVMLPGSPARWDATYGPGPFRKRP